MPVTHPPLRCMQKEVYGQSRITFQVNGTQRPGKDNVLLIHIKKKKIRRGGGAEETVQWVRALPVLPED